jgi:hypothetical protein
MKNESIMSQIPPGTGNSFTDRDRQAAAAKFPSPDASIEEWEKFARGQEKWKLVDSRVRQARAEFVIENGGPGAARRNIVAGGYAIKPGQSWVDVAGNITKDVIRQVALPSGAKSANNSAAQTMDRLDKGTQREVSSNNNAKSDIAVMGEGDAIIRGGK